VFNCGIGMAVVVAPAHAERALKTLKAAGETAWRIGRIVRRARNEPQVEIV
jgi:phosphoribosylformylglycinamidine cyclo-ligase